MPAPHVVLLGDSIFDNARYVPGGPSVIEHLRRVLPAAGRATLLAVDGAGAEDVARQVARLPADVRPEAMDVPHFTDTALFRWLFHDDVLDIVEPMDVNDYDFWIIERLAKADVD